jgi:hypothetical protein
MALVISIHLKTGACPKTPAVPIAQTIKKKKTQKLPWDSDLI